MRTETGASPHAALSTTPVPACDRLLEGARAILYRPSRSVMSSHPQRRRPWVLAFERKAPPTIEPLMGWTSDTDPVAQVRMRFPSLDAAVAYARKYGIAYEVFGLADEREEPPRGIILPAGGRERRSKAPAARRLRRPLKPAAPSRSLRPARENASVPS